MVRRVLAQDGHRHLTLWCQVGAMLAGVRGGCRHHDLSLRSRSRPATVLPGLGMAHRTPANASDRAQVAALAADVQAVTGQMVPVGFVDQGDTGDDPAAAAAEHGICLEVVTLEGAKRGFVLLPRRWVVERSFAWAARFRRLAKDDERLPETVAGLHFVAFASLMLHRFVTLVAQRP